MNQTEPLNIFNYSVVELVSNKILVITFDMELVCNDKNAGTISISMDSQNDVECSPIIIISNGLLILSHITHYFIHIYEVIYKHISTILKYFLWKQRICHTPTTDRPQLPVLVSLLALIDFYKI